MRGSAAASDAAGGGVRASDVRRSCATSDGVTMQSGGGGAAPGPGPSTCDARLSFGVEISRRGSSTEEDLGLGLG